MNIQKDPAVMPKQKQEDLLDDALADSFPASDPVASAAPSRSVVADPDKLDEHAGDADQKSKAKP
jgi:hypothetical protein